MGEEFNEDKYKSAGLDINRDSAAETEKQETGFEKFDPEFVNLKKIEQEISDFILKIGNRDFTEEEKSELDRLQVLKTQEYDALELIEIYNRKEDVEYLKYSMNVGSVGCEKQKMSEHFDPRSSNSDDKGFVPQIRTERVYRKFVLSKYKDKIPTKLLKSDPVDEKDGVLKESLLRNIEWREKAEHTKYDILMPGEDWQKNLESGDIIEAKITSSPARRRVGGHSYPEEGYSHSVTILIPEGQKIMMEEWYEPNGEKKFIRKDEWVHQDIHVNVRVNGIEKEEFLNGSIKLLVSKRSKKQAFFSIVRENELQDNEIVEEGNKPEQELDKEKIVLMEGFSGNWTGQEGQQMYAVKEEDGQWGAYVGELDRLIALKGVSSKKKCKTPKELMKFYSDLDIGYFNES